MSDIESPCAPFIAGLIVVPPYVPGDPMSHVEVTKRGRIYDQDAEPTEGD